MSINESIQSMNERIQVHFGYTAKPRTCAPPLMRERLTAEMVGTFFLVLTVGVSVAGGSDMAPVAIGLVLGIQVYTFASVSGACLNPAVTLAVLLAGRNNLCLRSASMYVGAQIVGAVLAGLCAYAVTDYTFCFDYVQTKSWSSSFILEVFFTMALCSTVLTTGVSKDAPNHYYGFAIGLTVTGGALASSGFDQASLNPAVTVGINIANYANPGATLTASFSAWVLFLVAPLLGACLAAAVFRGTRSYEFGYYLSDESRAASQEASTANAEVGATV
jgi:aquaporin Z